MTENNSPTFCFLFYVVVPESPQNVAAAVINSTAVQLTWDPPSRAHGVQDINYNVSYHAPFWNDFNNSAETGNSKIISGLKPGTNYIFSVRVYAGNAQSDPCSTNNMTGKGIQAFYIHTYMCNSF